MTLAITGASGNLGRRTAELLLEGGVDPSQVVLLTRTPSNLDDFAAKGVQVRAADFDDPSSLPAAFDGVDRLLLISTDTVGARIEQQTRAIDAAKAAGVGHVIYTSAPQPSTENPALVVVDHLATEEHLRASGLDWTFLRNNLYSEFQLGSGAQAVASGQIFTNAGDRGAAYVSREDCAAAAAAVLAGGAEHAGQAYEISGGEALTQDQVAALLTEVTGKPVAVVQVDDEGLTGGLTAAGLPDFIIPVLVTFGTAQREGYLDLVTTAVADLTGRQPTPLRDVLVAGKDELQAPQPAAH
ncbi:MAG: SDR family oxidoreductase [Solirubrobacteraceae bacterium]|nr:SDR family oxidoreductase [Solirubrobacteraceae bacterium]